MPRLAKKRVEGFPEFGHFASALFTCQARLLTEKKSADYFVKFNIDALRKLFFVLSFHECLNKDCN